MGNREITMRIKALIDKKEVSPSAFAKLIGFSQSNLSKVLRGERNVPSNLISAICDNLGVSYNWLVNGDGNMLNDEAHVSEVSDRLASFLKYKGKGQTAFEQEAGLSRGYVQKASDNMGYKIKSKISEYCPELNMDWLLTGEGDMLKDEQHVSEVTEVKSLSNLKSKDVKKNEQMVNLYDFEASAGLRSLLDNNHANVIDSIRIPNLPKCDGAIHIVGDSMYPLLKSGDIVLYKEMPVDMQHLFYGEMYLISYIIEGDAYVVVKYINRSPQGEPYVTLVSQNPHHADRDIDFRTVNALALVKASIRINCMM